MRESTSEIWRDDRLGRHQDAYFLYRFLIGQVEKRLKRGKIASYVVNVDAGWGGGKSFFLERFERQLRAENHIVASINAWRDDHAEDPYVAIMAAIDKAFEPYVKKGCALTAAWNATKSNGGRLLLKAAGGAVKVLAKRHLDIKSEDIFEAVDQGLIGEAAEVTVEQSLEVGSKEIEKLFDTSLEKMIGHFQKTTVAMQNFRQKLGKSIATLEGVGKTPPLFILVDELDRCRPSYAIHLLERMKHLFEVDRVVFVFATNSSQLQHSVSGAYGPNFDGFMYLKRFFDRTYVFGPPDGRAFIQELCAEIDPAKVKSPATNVADFIEDGRKLLNIDLRSISQVIDIIDATATAWHHPWPIDLTLLFPLAASFHLIGKAEWTAVNTDALVGWQYGDVVDDRLRGRIDRRVSIPKAFQTGVRCSKRLQDALELGERDNQDATTRYVFAMFTPELQKTIHGESVLASLPSLVGNAGRIATAQ
ncbi:KAP P-loop domain-containing protein [Rhizobium sp. N541]|uniref:KAP family P-loop NTPase fold protein n=1 Tax=unclassified Rhizobium TaxID=2613769 RepID=UPI0007EE8969|nr:MULTISPECIES: P-loop NTPase fold protein [unclassified Rhizobium]ANM17182.1 KAP P-loop domain-containing protein [Rhizobium sp. N541]ANM23567.1 KAP P-loop domain-containing protein [Rhizobium sp. N941]